MDLYRDIILDHYKNPRNFGTLKAPDRVAEASNTTCGDSILITIKYSSSILHGETTADKHASILIEDIRFSGTGCAISMASASMLTEKVKHMTKEDVQKLTTGDVLELLQTTLTPSRVKCATLPLEVIQKALVE